MKNCTLSRARGPSASPPPQMLTPAARSLVAAFATPGRILPVMPLPPDFYWTTRSASLPNDAPTVIACSGVWVVAMAQRVGEGIWIASLDRHRHGPGGPFRWCTSYEQGRAGAEMWVTRHEARLREDVVKITAYREAVRANRLAGLHLKPPFGWEG
ncbi:hypothetical protein QEK83_002237 [Stenotrophomonas maltophilia]|uniref:Uncharacterized protein n=1 Tax=Stenotrophomonas maltophilia TaxID=40324 RepID=A0AAI9CB94_STEMA|nr:hypothetical protein [Stenotrophomonas maltophilia]